MAFQAHSLPGGLVPESSLDFYLALMMAFQTRNQVIKKKGISMEGIQKVNPLLVEYKASRNLKLKRKVQIWQFKHERDPYGYLRSMTIQFCV
jgi:hypothetical protein